MKKLLCLLLCLSLALPLLGCHGGVRQDSFQMAEGMTFDTSKTYEITFWAKNDTNLTQVQIYKKAIADFEALYPNIKVNMKLYTDYRRIYSDVITNISTGTTPNVCITYPDHIATYLEGSNIVVALDALYADPKYGLGGSELRYDSPTMEEMIPQFLQEGSIDGKFYAMPFMRSTEACYVNKTYVERLGYTLPEVLTWDFVWEVSDAATKKNANGLFQLNGQDVLIPFIYKSTDNMMIQMLRQQNAGYSTQWGEVLLFNDDTRKILDTVARYAKRGAFSTFEISSYPANFLNAGQCVFAIDSTAGATWMGSDAPNMDIDEKNLVDFETVVMPIPQYDPANPQMISQGPSVCIFNKEDSQEVLASWLFAQYLLTNDVQIAYAQTEGYVPVTAKAQQSQVYQDYLSRAGENNDLYYDVKIQASQLLLDNTENTFVTPVFNGSANLRSAAGDLIEGVTKACRRNKPVDEKFYTNLQAEMISLYHLDQIPRKQKPAGEQAPGNANGAAVTPVRRENGPLPAASVFLLVALGVTWVGILAYLTAEFVKKRKKQAK